MQGTYKDAVLCKECQHTRFRVDQFMDLSLVIRPFGSAKVNGSVEEAIDFFVRPETMSDGNQVRVASQAFVSNVQPASRCVHA